MKEGSKPLEGVKVMDLSIYVAGPACSSLLGYLGANVIKVESLNGDRIESPARVIISLPNQRKTPYSINATAIKRGVALDFRSKQGREACHRIAADADILITNYREKALAGMGLTYEEVCQFIPAVIYASMSGYGDKGPDAERPGFDSTAFFSRSGFCMRGTYQGYAPVAPISAAGDTIASMALTVGVLAAFMRRTQTNLGEKVTSSLYGSALWVMGIPIVQAQFGYIGPFPREEPGLSTFHDYECKDGNGSELRNSAERYCKPLAEALGMEEI